MTKKVMNNKIVYKSYISTQLQPHLSDVAEFRVKHFRNYPYLYDGNLDYEKNYLAGLANDKKSLLIKAYDSNNHLIAVSTSVPLVTGSDILKSATESFATAGYDPGSIYYYGEIIIEPQYRGFGISAIIYKMQDDYAKLNKFKFIALATVIRSDNDLRKPANHQPSDPIWNRFGFTKTNIIFDYDWPTIQSDFLTENESHKMVYWLKKI